MTEIYVGWFKGAPQNPEALKILKDGGIAGMEMSNIDDSVEKVIDAGLKYNAHCPGRDLTLNLANPNYLDAFDGEQGKRLLELINMSEVPGFHLGYSCEEVYKMNAFPNIPRGEPLSRGVLLERLVQNITDLNTKINKNLESNKPQIALETLDYSRPGQQVPWDTQKEEVINSRTEIESLLDEYGTNAALLHITEPEFIADFFKKLDTVGVPAGFIADVGHMYISKDGLLRDGKFEGTVGRYVGSMLEAVGNRTSEIHLTVPTGNPDKGWSDQHYWFGHPEAPIGDKILELAGVVKDKSPNLKLVTLEMREHGKEPVEFAEIVIEQANLVKRELNI